MDSISGRGALEVDVIVRIFVVCLDNVVIHVLDGKIGLYRAHLQGLEFQHGHGPRGVLKKYLVDSDADFLTRNQFSFNQVSFEYLLGQILSHYFLLLSLLQLFLLNPDSSSPVPGRVKQVDGEQAFLLCR